MLRSCKTLLFAAIAITLYTEVQQAQAAYCALRDPVQDIYTFFPEADAYRSIIRTVDVKAREQVAERLPFTLHFNELAKHTLYVAIAKTRPVGLVHVRSEKGKWGLIEIAWSFDLDLNIHGFSFQRCRDMHKTVLEEGGFRSQIIGKTLEELRPMLSKDGLSINTDQISVPEGSETLVLTLLRSAMKTITVTDIVWSQDLKFLSTLAEAKSMFPQTSKLIQVQEIYTPQVKEALKQIGQKDESPVERKTAEVYLALDETDTLQGFLMKAECLLQEQRVTLWLGVTPDHQIHQVNPIKIELKEKLKKMLKGLKGMTEQDIVQGVTISQRVGAEAIVVSRFHSMG